jgi:glycosyltransferase involved in cell wall biosynthesis
MRRPHSRGLNPAGELVVDAPRVLMISRHYWPHHCVDAANRDVRLADALHRTGIDIEVLSPRYASSWPDQLMHREIVVHRPIAAPRSQWSIGRYIKNLQAWLGEHAGRYDVLFSTRMNEEVVPVVQIAVHSQIGCVVGHSGTGAAADHLTWETMRYGRRIRASLGRCDAIVTSWASVHRDLIAMGIAPQRVHRIDLGVMAAATSIGRDAPAGGDQDPNSNSAAVTRSRTALAEVNGDLAAPRGSLVVLSCGQLRTISGTMTLAHAAVDLIDRWPDLRFWFVGDGPQREALHSYLRTHGARQNVALPGTFVDFEDLFRAADLFVVPSAADTLEDTLAAAVAAGIPLVVADSADTRAFFGGQDPAVLWCAADDGENLRAAIAAALADLPGRRAAAALLRRRLLQSRPYESSVRAYKQLLQTLAEVSRQRRGVASAAGSPALASGRLPVPLSAPRQMKSEN